MPIEPFPTPSILEQDLSEILAEVKSVDHMFFAGWHYSLRVSRDRTTEAFYGRQSSIARRFCAHHGINCGVA